MNRTNYGACMEIDVGINQQGLGVPPLATGLSEPEADGNYHHQGPSGAITAES